MEYDYEKTFEIEGLTFRMRVIRDDEDEWWWIGVEVKLLDLDGNIVHLPVEVHDSVWGIESDAEDYHMTVAKEIANEIAAQLKGKDEVCVKIRKEAK